MRIMGNRSLLLCLGLLVLLAIMCGQAAAKPFGKFMERKAAERKTMEEFGTYRGRGVVSCVTVCLL